jgi:two-component system, chemotaxis family, protein-glutamate methylesterase/glutaminase
MINVLIVDDSAVARSLLEHILNGDPDIQVVAAVADGMEAIKAIERTKPDVVTMDISMPGMDGFQVTRQIMGTTPTPIIIVSSLVTEGDSVLNFKAMDAGAVAVLPRPYGIGHSDYGRVADELIRTVKAMSEVKLVRRWSPKGNTLSPSLKTGLNTADSLVNTNPLAQQTSVTTGRAVSQDIKLVAIGASTGGPPVLRSIIETLPYDIPVPVVIVQHMTGGFTQGFVDWLANSCNRTVLLPADGDKLLRGNVYIAPEGVHLGVRHDIKARLTTTPPEHGMRPAVSFLFRSIIESLGPNAIGVLLTGMGKDGSAELKAMRDAGAITIAQDSETSVVHGMPGEAIKLGGATYVRPGNMVGSLLTSLLQRVASG